MPSPIQPLGRRRRARTAGGVAALTAVGAAAALAAASAGAAVSARAVAAARPSCATAQLHVTFINQSNGALGTIYYPIRFTNRGARACTLRGYPGVSAISRAGAQIGQPATRVPTPFTTVTLAPRRSVNSMVGFVHTAFLPASKCKPVRARGLRIYPPNQVRSVTIQRSFSACSGTSVHFLTVLPVK